MYMNWVWDDGGGVLTAKMKCKTVAVGDSVRLIALGVYVEHDLYIFKAVNRLIDRRVEERLGLDFDPLREIISGMFTIEWPLASERQLRVIRREYSIDSASGAITGTGEENLENPAFIAADLLAEWTEDLSVSDLNLVGTGTTDATAFGSFRHAAEDLDEWLDDVPGASAHQYQHLISINSEKSVATTIDKICDQSPMMVFKGLDGTYRAVVYPEGTPDGDQQYKDSSASSVVQFHPNRFDMDSYGKPYGVHSISFEQTPEEGVFNKFLIRFGYYAPDRAFTSSVSVDKADYRVWSETSGAYLDTTDNDTLGEAAEAQCLVSFNRYGIEREMVVDADLIWRNATATAFLKYLVARYSQRRLIVKCTTYLETYDLQKGHIVKFTDDFNKRITVPSYAHTNWANSRFIVLDVKHVNVGDQVMVTWEAEELYSI